MRSPRAAFARSSGNTPHSLRVGSQLLYAEWRMPAPWPGFILADSRAGRQHPNPPAGRTEKRNPPGGRALASCPPSAPEGLLSVVGFPTHRRHAVQDPSTVYYACLRVALGSRPPTRVIAGLQRRSFAGRPAPHLDLKPRPQVVVGFEVGQGFPEAGVSHE